MSRVARAASHSLRSISMEARARRARAFFGSTSKAVVARVEDHLGHRGVRVGVVRVHLEDVLERLRGELVRVLLDEQVGPLHAHIGELRTIADGLAEGVVREVIVLGVPCGDGELEHLLAVVDVELVVVGLGDGEIEEGLAPEDVALRAAHEAEGRADVAVVGAILVERLEVLAGLGGAAGGHADLVEHEAHLGAGGVLALRQRRQGLLGRHVVAHDGLRLGHEHPRTGAVAARDLAQLGDGVLVFACDQHVAS
jgi:hypothetical protein